MNTPASPDPIPATRTPRPKLPPRRPGCRFGIEEERAAIEALRSGKLWYVSGTRVKGVEKQIGEMYSIPHVVMCSSGSAAVHTALAVCGEGGFIMTNDPALGRMARLFTDKGYDREAGMDRGGMNVRFLAYNYRMSELSAAVLGVQLTKLPAIQKKRQKYRDHVVRVLPPI